MPWCTPLLRSVGINSTHSRWKWVVNFTSQSLYSRCRSSRYPFTRNLGVPHCRSGRSADAKNLLSLSKIETCVCKSSEPAGPINNRQLTPYCTEQSSSWEARRFWASLEIPRIVLNPKVHYCVLSAPHLSLSCARSIQSLSHPSHFPKIHLNNNRQQCSKYRGLTQGRKCRS